MGRVLSIILALLFSLQVYSQKIDSLTEEHFVDLALPESRPNTSFRDGEKLEYLVHFGFLDAGKAFLSLSKTKLDSKDVYHAVARARTVGLANILYKVRDVYESYFDVHTGIPYKSIRNIKEGGYRWYNEVYFHHEEDSLYSKRQKKKFRTPDNILDVVSAFYYARNNFFVDLKVGEVVKFCSYFSDEFHVMRIKFMGYETIKTKVGKFRCQKFIPVVEKGRLFDTEEDLKVWVSADNRRLPVRVQSDLMIGSIKCDLVRIHSE